MESVSLKTEKSVRTRDRKYATGSRNGVRLFEDGKAGQAVAIYHHCHAAMESVSLKTEKATGLGHAKKPEMPQWSPSL